MARTTYVPLVSILVVRDDKQVDALEQYKTDGKAFKFEAHEIDEIKKAFGGQLEMALRSPTDESADEDAEVPAPVASNEKPKPNAKPAKDGDL